MICSSSVILALIFVLYLSTRCQVNAVVPFKRNKKENDGISMYCADDTNKYCSNEKNGFLILFCLEKRKSELTESCQDYLGTTTIGGCNQDVINYCSSEVDTADIYTCLKENEYQLTTDCLNNLNNDGKAANPWSSLKLKSKRITIYITRISIAYLLIPIVFAVWSLYRMRQLHKLQKVLLSEHLTKLHRFRSSGSSNSLSFTDISNTGTVNVASVASTAYSNLPSVTQLSMIAPKKVSFTNLSYWASERSYWNSSCKPVRHQILHDITGEIHPKTLTVIMGPSGSGKSTLLKLLAGQINDGEFSGIRAVNGRVYQSKKYDKELCRQGYVSQQDILLESLTVWQTLMYAAMIRMSDTYSMEEKLQYGIKIMENMGLSGVANTIVGGYSTGDSQCISGGQRRRLSIGIELLGNPSILYLDEPTSGLDATSSLKLVQILHSMSRRISTSIVMTIHQPRAECFSLFDNLILLGNQGHLIYSGPTEQAVTHLSAAACIDLALTAYDNPGDFIVDVLDRGCQYTERNSVGATDSSHTNTSNHNRDQNDEDGIEMTRTTASANINSSCVGTESASLLQSESNDQTDGDDAFDSNSIAFMKELNKHFLSSTFYSSLRSSIMDDIQRASNDSSSNSSSCNAHKSPVSSLQQIWILFARRIHMFTPQTTRDILMPILEVIAVTATVVFAFSYTTDTFLEKPYQILMLFFTISTYAMILQYLVLVPQYMAERRVILSERSSGIIAFAPYVASSMLAEVPRAIFQCMIQISILYLIHPLNPDPVNIEFCVVCLMVGVCAWQSLINICAVLSDNAGVVYTICFLVLGSGSLFGGLIIRLNKIPSALKFLYFASVAAVTQRALAVNDLQCCYMTVTCNMLAVEFEKDFFNKQHPSIDAPELPLLLYGDSNSSSISDYFGLRNSSSIRLDQMCPMGLRFTGDGSDDGNLGRLYLKVLGLEQDNPFTALLYLFWANIIFRIVAIVALYVKEYMKYQLKNSNKK